MRRRLVTVGVVYALSSLGCQPPPPVVAPPPPSPPALSAGDIALAAELLELEDARTATLERLAVLAAEASPQIRSRTALALGRLRVPGSLPLLERLLQDSDTAVAARAAFSLGQLGDTAAVAPLAGLVSSTLAAERPTVAAEAAYSLGKLGTDPAHGALQRFLGTSDAAGTQEVVVRSGLLAIWRFPRPADLSPLTRWMSAPSSEVRWRATYALIRRVDARAAPLLLEAVHDTNGHVRALAHRGLTAALVDSASLPPLQVIGLHQAALADPEYAVRINAIRALGSFVAHAEAVQTLRPVLEGTELHAAVAAMESLGRLGTAARLAAPRLTALSRSGDAHVFLRQSALEALALIDTVAAREAALELRNDPSWRLRLASARALAAVAPTGSEQRQLIADPDSRVAAGALSASITALGDSLGPLRNVLFQQLTSPDPGVRATALQGIGRLRDPGSLTMILDAYARAQQDPDNDVALAALDALAEFRGDGLDPSRAFFARFPRARDHLVRRRAHDLFGPATLAAWGDPGPAETRHAPEVYRSLIERWAAGHSSDQPVVEVVTSLGTVRLRLLGDWAPLTVYNLLSLAARGYFDGQEWPRVVPNFVVQGGDPRGDMTGGPGYSIRDELNPFRYQTGSLGMALSGPDTGGSQFFVTHSPQPHLDGVYTLFGEVISGQHVLEQLLPGDRIVTVRAVSGAGS